MSEEKYIAVISMYNALMLCIIYVCIYNLSRRKIYRMTVEKRRRGERERERERERKQLCYVYNMYIFWRREKKEEEKPMYMAHAMEAE